MTDIRRNIQCFFGLASSYNNIAEEIRNMADGISANSGECQIFIPSNFVGLGATRTNGDSQKNSVILTNRGDVTVLMDGEIYNLPELDTELKNQGYFTGGRLYDVVISAYEAWGTGCFSKLNGIYAMALWDKKKAKLYLNRDPHGAKALYYHFDEKLGLTFASRLSVIFQRKSISPDIEFASVQEYLRFLDISTPNTIYQKVYSLEPGCILEYNEKCYSLKTLEFKTQNTYSLTFREALDRLDHLLTKSIEKRFDSGKTGFFLSGGIDSSMLCALGAKIAPEKIEAFTVGFNDKKLDEMDVAREIVKSLGIRHHELYFDINQYFDSFNIMTSSFDYPFADPATIPTILIDRPCKDYVDVVLDGTGADSLIGIMPARYIRFALKFSSTLPVYLRNRIANSMKVVPKLKDYTPIFDFEEPEELFIRWQGWGKREIEQLCGVSCSLQHTGFYQVFNKYKKYSPLELYSALIGSLPDDRIHESASIYGLIIRFPFWDKEVVSFLKGLKTEYKYYKNNPKFILKELLNRYVPRIVWDKPKQGFNFPFEMLLKANNFKLINEYLNNDALMQHGFFDREVVKNYINRYIEGDISIRFKIWALVIFQAWYLSHYGH